MSTKTTSANPRVAIARKDVSTDGAKGASVETTPKATTWEELWKGHVDLPRTEDGFILLTPELLRNCAAGHPYAYRSAERLNKWVIKSKVSGVKEKGGKTLYDGELNGEPFEGWSIEDLKTAVGCDYRRAKDGAQNSKSPLAKLQYRLTSQDFSSLIDETANDEVRKAYDQLKGLVGILRAEEVKREEEERARTKAENAEAKKLESIKKLLGGLSPEKLAELLGSLN